jgi:hypothetical protein
LAGLVDSDLLIQGGDAAARRSTVRSCCKRGTFDVKSTRFIVEELSA